VSQRLYLDVLFGVRELLLLGVSLLKGVLDITIEVFLLGG